MRSCITCFLVLVLTLSSFVILNSVWAQTTPSVPEFTVTFVDSSHDIPPRFEMNTCTGKSEIAEAGYNVQNKSIMITIKNQASTTYRNENNSIVGLYYSIRVKGHFGEWYGDPSPDSYIYRSDLDFTVIYCGLSGNNGSDPFRGNIWLGGSIETQDGGQADVQIKAIIGHFTTIYGTSSPYDWMFGGDGTPSHHDVFTGTASDWSGTQIVAIPESSTASFLSPTPTLSDSPTESSTSTPPSIETSFPDQPNNQANTQLWPYLVIGAMAILVAALVGVIILLFKKTVKKN